MVTILQTNIIDYVSLCEKFSQTNMIDFMNRNYYRFIHDRISTVKGKLADMIADRQSAFWDDENERNNARNACKAAIQIKNDISSNCQKLGERQFTISMALVTGEVIVSKNQILGEKVNLCTRLTTLCKRYNATILIDEMTMSLCDNIKTQYIETVYIVGKKDPVKIFEFIGN